jgi:predicted dehydrogenase
MLLGHQVIAYDPEQLSMRRVDVIHEADAVIIASPTKAHASDLIDVLGARKHVLVEKPIGFDSPPFIAGLIMGARRAKPDLVVATGFMCRFHPVVQEAKKKIERGYFGRLEHASFEVRQKNEKPEYLRDGVIRNWASHEIDIARYLLGNLHVSECLAVMNKGQDISCLIEASSIEHEMNVQIAADYITDPEIRQFEIIGSNKSARYSLTKDNWDQVYLDEMSAFLRAVDGGDPGPLADGADGVAALEIVMQARQKAGLE